MKYFLLSLLCLPLALFAQEPTAQDSVPAIPADTTIYRFADEAPRFPTPCEQYDTTASAKTECSDLAVLAYVNQRAGYPDEARSENISGTAVIGFVIEADGIISRAKILRDPGGGLGLSAMRAVAEMARTVRWRPAYKDGKPVRFDYTLPIKFRIEDPKPYVVTGRDTVYVDLTKPVEFTGEEGSLSAYFNSNLNYPSVGEDSCLIGQLDMQLLITPEGRVRVQDIIDFNDLGSDFTFEAINVATKSYGKWSPAEYEGRQVTSAYNITVNFAPQSAACQNTVTAYNEAVEWMNQGQEMVADTNQLAAALAKMDLAVEKFPADGRFRIIRGQARMDNNLLMGACEDFTLAKSIALVDWYDGILPLLCRKETEE